MVQVPVVSSVAPGVSRYRARQALLSCTPHTTSHTAGRPRRSAIAGVTGPSTSHAGRTGANRSAMPLRSAHRENRASVGDHSCVWHPSDDTSLAATPESHHAQYCGYGSQWRMRAQSSGRADFTQWSCRPALSPIGRFGEPVWSNGSSPASNVAR